LLLAAGVGGYCWWYGRDPQFRFPTLSVTKDPDEIRRCGKLARELRRQRDRAPDGADPEAARSRREHAYLRVMQSRAAEQVLAQMGGPAYPAEPSWHRRAACWILRKPAADASLWVDAYLKAYDDQLAAVEAFYNAVDACTSAQTPSAVGIRFVFRRPRPPADAAAVTYDRLDTRTDWELWISQPAEGGVRSAQWSGMLLARQPWHREDAALRPEWPPAAEDLRVQNEDACARLLHAGRVPPAFGVRRARARTSGLWEKPALDLTFDLVCADFPDWSLPKQQLRFDGEAPMEALHKQLRALGAGARADLEKHLLTLRAWKELPVRVAQTGDEGAPLRVHFRLPALDPVEIKLGARLTDEGRLVLVHTLPDVPTRLELAERVVKAEGRLAAYRGRLQLKGVKVLPSSRLRLEFDLGEAARPDAPVVEGIVWELGPDGKGRVKLPPGFPAKGAAQVAPIPAPAQDPDSADAVRSAARAHLRSSYAALDGAVEIHVTPGPQGGSLLSLALTVADLEALQLGPTPAYRAAEVPGLIDQLLSEATVLREAKRQWAGRNGPRRHLLLKAWNPATVIALLSHEVRLTEEVKLPWEEEVRREGKAWKRLSEAEVNAGELRKRADALLASAPALRAELGPLVVHVGVNPDYFGNGRWLRLDPPAVALRAKVVVKLLGLSARVDDLLLDESGLHWGQAEYTFEFTGTISLPWFAITNSRLIVRPARAELEVQGCVTPPVPAPPGLLPPAFQNPWLDIAYFHVGIRGRWDAPVLSGSASLVVWQRRVAEAGLSLDFVEGEFRAYLRAGNALPEMEKLPFRLVGNVCLSLKKRSLDAGLEASAGPARLGGQFRFALKDNGPYIAAVGNLWCGPLKAQLKGYVGNNFEDYSLSGKGTVDLKVGKAYVLVELDRAGFRVKTGWEEAQNGPKEVYRAASLEDIDVGELRKALGGSGGGGNGPGDSGDGPPPPPPVAPPVPPPATFAEEAPPANPPAAPAPIQRFGGSKLEVKFRDGAVVFLEKETGALLLSVPSAPLGVKDPAECEYMYWRQQDGTGDVLVFAPAGSRRVVHVHAAKGAAPAVSDLTAGYRALLDDLFAAAPGRAAAARDAAETHFEVKITPGAPAEPAAIRAESGGYGFDYWQRSSDGEKRLHCQFFWVRNEKPHRAILYAPYVAPEQRTPDFFGELSALATEASYVIIVAHDPGRKRFAWLTRGDDGAWLLALNAADPKKAAPVILADVPRPYHGAHALATACLKDSSAWDVKRVWIGPQGVCADVGDGWILMRLAEAKPAACRLTRDRFDRWAKDSRRYLPPAWREEEARKKLSSAEVARVAVADYQQLRQREPQWQANPLGLLLGLARSD
jgi:hypothetical protein